MEAPSERNIISGQVKGSILADLDPHEAASSLLVRRVSLRGLARGAVTHPSLHSNRKQAIARLAARPSPNALINPSKLSTLPGRNTPGNLTRLGARRSILGG